jgi:hypothetical protein
LNPVAREVSKAIEKFHFPISSVTTKVSGRVSIIFSKFKALIRNKFLLTKPSYQRSLGTKETAAGSELLNIVTLLLTPKEATGTPTAAEQELVTRRRR